MVSTVSGSLPDTYAIGSGAVSSRVQRPERAATHLFLFNAEFQNEWSYTFSPTLCCDSVLLGQLYPYLRVQARYLYYEYQRLNAVAGDCGCLLCESYAKEQIRY
jgi:hypothetical protein